MKKQNKKVKFNIQKGQLVEVDWVDHTTFQDIADFDMKHPSSYLTPTTNVDFFVTKDKDSIMISHMTYGAGPQTKFDNVTLIPKALIKNILIHKRIVYDDGRYKNKTRFL